MALCFPLGISAQEYREEWNPPARYDHEYDGDLTLFQLPQAEVANLCEEVFDAAGFPVEASQTQRGCSWQRGDSCFVVTIDTTYSGSTPDAVLRHELGHCNGWPYTHPE